jgi:hypothetical protein
LVIEPDCAAAVRAVGHDGHQRHPGPLRGAHEAAALAEHDAVAQAEVAVGVEVTAGVDEHLAAGGEDALRVLGRRAHGELARAAHRVAVAHEGGRGGALRGRREVQRAALVVPAEAAPALHLLERAGDVLRGPAGGHGRRLAR